MTLPTIRDIEYGSTITIANENNRFNKGDNGFKWIYVASNQPGHPTDSATLLSYRRILAEPGGNQIDLEPWLTKSQIRIKNSDYRAVLNRFMYESLSVLTRYLIIPTEISTESVKRIPDAYTQQPGWEIVNNVTTAKLFPPSLDEIYRFYSNINNDDTNQLDLSNYHKHKQLHYSPLAECSSIYTRSIDPNNIINSKEHFNIIVDISEAKVASRGGDIVPCINIPLDTQLFKIGKNKYRLMGPPNKHLHND